MPGIYAKYGQMNTVKIQFSLSIFQLSRSKKDYIYVLLNKNKYYDMTCCETSSSFSFFI